MRRLGILVGVAVLLAFTVPVFAQGMFADVPTDHWAYQAVNELQGKGFVIGYPDGTFGGKRAMTRYEFAMAINRLWQEVSKMVGQPGPAGPAGPQGPEGPAGPQGPPGVKPEELQQIQRLAQEFKDELTRLGTDVDQLKKDVKALTDRVAAVEKEQERVKVSLRGDMIAQGTAAKRADVAKGAVDIDGRPLGAAKTNPNQLLNNVAVLWDYDLTIKGKVDEKTTATAVINASTYLPAAGSVSSVTGAAGIGDGGPTGGETPASRLIGQVGSTATEVTPWYFYVERQQNLSFIGETNLTVGKFPLQLTPYTFKMVDVDYYTNLPKTDSGDFPVTGIKAQKSWGSVDVTAFAVSHKRTPFVAAPGTAIGTSNLNNEIGSRPFSQSAGARLVWSASGMGKLGLTYLQAGLPDVTFAGLEAGRKLSRADIYGVDYNAKYLGERLGVYAEYAKSDYKAGSDAVNITGPAGTRKSNKNNGAVDAMLTYNIGGGLVIGGGYRDIEPNFYSPGYWHRIAFVKNPVNVKGGRGLIGYKFSESLDVQGTFESLDESKNTAADATIERITANANWKVYNSNVSLGFENVRLKEKVGTARKTTNEANYFDVGYGYSFSDNLSLRFYYQYIDWKDKIGDGDYKGNVAGTQLTVKF